MWAHTKVYGNRIEFFFCNSCTNLTVVVIPVYTVLRGGGGGGNRFNDIYFIYKTSHSSRFNPIFRNHQVLSQDKCVLISLSIFHKQKSV